MSIKKGERLPGEVKDIMRLKHYSIYKDVLGFPLTMRNCDGRKPFEILKNILANEPTEKPHAVLGLVD